MILDNGQVSFTLVLMKKPNQPDEVVPGPGYSFAVDCKVNAWMFAALVMSLATDLFFRHEVRELPVFLRTLAAVAPLIALILWMRRLCRWICGMDELHRSITIVVCLFSTATTFFIIAGWHHLSRLEVLQGLFQGRFRAYGSMDICVLWLILWLLLIFYAFGLRIFTRRYQ
jgi:hypothetical protein